MLGRTIYDITQLLESATGANERVRRALELLRGLVPYDRCALLVARLGDPAHFVVVPETLPGERIALNGTLVDILGKLIDAKTRASSPPEPREGVHLAVPLVGLDEVIGLLFVRSSGGEYSEEHVRALSVVAAMLASYFTMLSTGVEVADLTRGRDEARLAAAAATRLKDAFVTLVSDQLRAPLAEVLACVEVLRSTSATAAERDTALDELERTVQAQIKLVGEPALPSVEQSAEDRLLAGIRVLLIDHNLEIRESFQSVLEDYGAEVITANSAPEALAALVAKKRGT